MRYGKLKSSYFGTARMVKAGQLQYASSIIIFATCLCRQVWFYASSTTPSMVTTLHWRHNERDGDLNHRRLDCLLKRLFRHISKKILKLRVTGFCKRIPLSQGASNAENVSTWWRHHDVMYMYFESCFFNNIRSFRTKCDTIFSGANMLTAFC